MTNSIIEAKNAYNFYIDQKANEIAKKYIENKEVTIEILRFINQLYQSTKLSNYEEENFESAYHNPITSDVEFLIARIIYYIVSYKGLNWKVLLRKQKNKCAPDIRIEHEDTTKFIIEIKVKAGWIQQIFSDKRLEHDKKRYDNNLIFEDPEENLNRLKQQYIKYQDAFSLDKSRIYVLVASLSNVHRKKYSDLNVKTYKNTFERNSDLPFQNIIVLSENLEIDLSLEENDSLYSPSNDFESMLNNMFCK